MQFPTGKAKYLAGAALCLLFGATAGRAEDGAIQWYKDLGQASEAARKKNQPMMIDFWADWCAPCKIMDAEVYSHPALRAAARQKIVAVRIHFDLQPELARKYNVEALPCLVFTNSYGTELLRHRGFLEAEDLTAVLRALPADLSEINRLDRILREDPNRFESLRAMGRQLRAAGFFGSSNGFYEKALQREEAKKDSAQREAILLEMGLNSLELHDGKQAAATFEKGLKEFPQSERRADLLLGLGQAYVLSEAPDKARKYLREIVAQYPNSATAETARKILTQLP